jgi:hypothetical protein
MHLNGRFKDMAAAKRNIAGKSGNPAAPFLSLRLPGKEKRMMDLFQ